MILSKLFVSMLVKLSSRNLSSHSPELIWSPFEVLKVKILLGALSTRYEF